MKDSAKKRARSYAFGYFFMKHVIRHVAKRDYGFEIPTLRLPDGANLVLCNHVTTHDPYMAMVAFDNKPLYPVIAKDFIKLKYRKLLDRYFHPIWKDKSLQDPGIVLSLLRRLKEGESILLFPEGNRTFSTHLCALSPSLYKLISKCKANVVFTNVVGGLTVDPRFALSYRKGKMDIAVRKIISKEELEKMSLQEVEEAVKTNLTVNEIPSTSPSFSDYRAEKLERVLYRCPMCKSISTIFSKGNIVYCSACKMEATYGENLTFINPSHPSFPHVDLYSWYEEQEDYVRAFSPNGDDIIYQDGDANLEDIGLDHQTALLSKVRLTMNQSELLIGDRVFPLSDITEMAVSGRQTFLFYSAKKTYRVSSDIIGFNALKYMQMFYHLRALKEGREDDFLGI